jgi:FAD synthase
MKEDHVRSRLHDALHRGHQKVSEEELAEVTAVVLAVVTELSAELALVIAELADRVEALEAAR